MRRPPTASTVCLVACLLLSPAAAGARPAPGDGAAGEDPADDAEPSTAALSLLYQEIPPETPPELRLLAANNLGVKLLRAGEPGPAVEILAAAVRELADHGIGVDAMAQSRIHFNYGQALEATAEEERALEHYLEAVDHEPALRSAVGAGFRLAAGLADPDRGLGAACDLISGLLARGDLETAEALLRRSLANPDWLRAAASGDLLTLLVDYLTFAKVRPQAFQAGWWADLETARRHLGPGPDLRLQQISRAYLADFALADGGGKPGRDGHKPGRDWRPAEAPRGPFAALLKTIGDGYYQEGDKRRALQRYWLAWNLAPEERELAEYVASLLRDSAAEADPEGWLREGLLDLHPELAAALRPAPR